MGQLSKSKLAVGHARLTLGGAALVIWAATCAWGQFSPGALSKAHHSVSGPANCTSCHALATGSVKFKCLNCHAEIAVRLKTQKGLHPKLVNSDGEKKECNHCHAEHQGEAFVPIRWEVDLREFDHARTGYVLEGAHRSQDCRKCHTSKHISDGERRKMPSKNLNRTYLGLSAECLSCHADTHHGQLGSDCLQCHTYTKWKPASKFDHTLAKFQPAGAHEKVTCEKCHQKVGEPIAYTKFKDLPFQTCDACHKDPHRAAFSATCSSCHTDAGWKPANVVASQFDHARTEFPLAGKHSALACAKCHITSDFKTPVAHAKCVDCHKTDPHNRQFANRTDRGECSSCHVVNGWKPASFNVASHQATRFPLEDRHAAVPCAKCHVPAGQATKYRIQYGQCTDCHADKHQNQFAAAPHLNRCEDCHSVKGFQRSTFSLVRHEKTRLPLLGAHAAIPCGQCHNDPQSGHAQPGRFRFADLSCNGCHQDPHKGQFQARMEARQPNGTAAGCEACHEKRTCTDVSKFDHSTSAFSLSGTHRGVPCEKCHREALPGGGVKTVVFRSAAHQCSGCHEDPHGGQFAAVLGKADCSRCHTPLQWTPAAFDHDTTTSFALTGGHREVKCAGCHKAERRIDGKNVRMYKAASKECTSCHGPEARG